MTIGESCDVNTLLRWILGKDITDEEAGVTDVSEADAKAAAMRLADRSHRSLSAGFSGAKVAKQWGRGRAGKGS